ncbi:O-antigen ligase family protein [Candidatus Gottesmanbacteria bacterium]|nr:O-antigen ligase family protein [Candidatus Gottesmanbacteria bacterium]
MNSLFGRLSSRVHLFFLIFGVSLFLGDGRQTGIDLYWAVVTIATTHQWKTQKNRFALPRILLVVGLMFLTTSLVSTFFSWSPGYSISAFMRIIIAVIWLIRFSRITKQEITTFMNDCSLLALFFTPIASLALLLPRFSTSLPPLNLIALPSGHLPIGYMALAVLPLVYVISRRKHNIALLSLFSTLGAILLSFSRASIALAVLFFLIMLQKHKTRRSRLIVFANTTIVLAATVLLFLWIIAPPNIRAYPFIPASLRVYLIKNSFVDDPRFEYIRQTMEAFRLSPIIGTGPGTFALISKQLSESSALMSSYAHNIWIQTLGEYGALGALPLAIIAIYYVWLWHREKNKPEKVLIRSFWQAALLIVILAVFEQSLDRYGVSIFLAVCLGIILTLTDSSRRAVNMRLLPLLLVVVIYAVSWIASDVASFRQKPLLGFLLAPYREIKAVDLALLAPKEKEQQLILRFFSRDPAVDIAFARGAKDVNDRIPWYEKAIRESPNDPFLEKNYLSLLFASGNTIALCQEFLKFSRIEELNCADEPLPTFMKSDRFRELLQILSSDDGPAKFFYGSGFNLLPQRYGEQLAILLWARARDIAPNWGYYHVELASLIAQHSNSYQAAVPTLLRCLTNKYSRFFCQFYLDHLPQLPPPGTFGKQIFAIPDIVSTSQ